MITPTIGRMVWFWPVASDTQSNFVVHDRNQALSAQVVYVWNDRLVNLVVHDHAGNAHKFTSVPLRQPDDERPQGFYCEWMPFQQAQAHSHQHQQIMRSATADRF